MRAGHFIGIVSIVAASLAALPLMAGKEGSPLKQFLPGIFGAPETGPKPEETLVAPFAARPAANMAPAPVPAEQVDQTPIDQPHRTSAEIGIWVTRAVGDSLEFDTSAMDTRLQEVSSYFTQEGFESYKTFLAQARLGENLASGDLSLHSYVEQTPLLLNKGISGGSFSWLMEVQVMISYLPRGTHTYEGSVPANQEFTINVQVGRVPGASGDGILIEQWHGQVKP